MAGGVGSRLWPVSTPEMPKQFIDLLGVGRTMIQLTVDRFLPVCEPDHFWVVTSGKYVSTVREQLPDIPAEQILAEPVARNTAPCIAYACRKIAKRFPDANVVVTPADALVLRTEAFAEVMRKALAAVDGSGRIVTVGIQPTRPATGYGYIKSSSMTRGEVVKVLEFKEKPDLETAQAYLEAGNYFWNAGIFVWNVKTVNAAMAQHAPQISGVMDRLEPSFYTDGEEKALAELFPTCDKISIDYAVMEKSDAIYVVAEDLGWTDLGNWQSVQEKIPADENGNSAVGRDIRLFGCKDCIVHAEDAERVVVEGLEGYIVAARNGNILVCRRENEQAVKDYSR